MKQYFERRITYDEQTQNYKISVPELGIEIYSDTESLGLIEIRKEIQEAAKKQYQTPTPDDQSSSLYNVSGPFTITLPSAETIKGWKVTDISNILDAWKTIQKNHE